MNNTDTKIIKVHGKNIDNFFQNIITGYLSGDTRIIEFITELKYIIAKQGKAKISKSQSLRQKGQNIKQMYNLDEKQKQDIFDIIAEEFPDL